MKRASRPTFAVASLLMGVLLMGCASQEVHEENVKDANARWWALKSDIAMQMAEDQFNSGQLGQAQKTIEEAMGRDRENPGLWLMGGRIALEESKLETAYQRLNRSIEFGEPLEGYDITEKAKPYYYQGIINQRWQRYERAQESYALAYERDPENVSYFVAKVEMMLHLDQLQEAVAELEDKSGYFDQNPTVRALLGHVYRRLGNDAKAATWFKQAAMLAPQDMKLKEEVARSQHAVGRYNEAISGLSELTKSDYGRKRADLFRLLAESYVSIDKLHEAKGVYAELTRLDRTSTLDWSKLGELAYRLGEEGQALQAANRLTNLAPDHYKGYLLAGMVWNRQGQLDRALGLFDRAADLAPNLTTPLIMRGIALQKNNKPGAAADAYKQALTINPDDARAKYLLTSVTENLH